MSKHDELWDQLAYVPLENEVETTLTDRSCLTTAVIYLVAFLICAVATALLFVA